MLDIDNIGTIANVFICSSAGTKKGIMAKNAAMFPLPLLGDRSTLISLFSKVNGFIGLFA